MRVDPRWGRIVGGAVAAALIVSAWTALAQQGAEACKAISRGADRLECFDKAYGVETKLAAPIPSVKVKSLSVRPDGSVTTEPPRSDDRRSGTRF